MTTYVEIVEIDVTNREGVSARSGNAYKLREQTAWLHRSGQQYPEKFSVTLWQEDVPLNPGKYHIADESFVVGRFGRLELRPKLVPLQKTRAA